MQERSFQRAIKKKDATVYRDILTPGSSCGLRRWTYICGIVCTIYLSDSGNDEVQGDESGGVPIGECGLDDGLRYPGC